MKSSKIVSYSALLLITTLACSATSNLATNTAPAPTSTPLPSPIPSPTPNPILFEDKEFNGTCNVDSTADVKRFVENGQLNMRVLTPLYVAWTECSKTAYSDFVMEVDATQVSGPDNNTYGIIFRHGLDSKEFYTFLIGGDGYYVFTVDGADLQEPEILVKWTESPAIKKGAQTNHIKVIAVGKSMKYYVNDQLLGEVQDARFNSGSVGFFVGTLKEGDVQVSFDNLKISKP